LLGVLDGLESVGAGLDGATDAGAVEGSIETTALGPVEADGTIVALDEQPAAKRTMKPVRASRCRRI